MLPTAIIVTPPLLEFIVAELVFELEYVSVPLLFVEKLFVIEPP